MDNLGDIFLIGEQHTNEAHAQAQRAIIEDLEPDVVLREGFNDRDWDEIEETVDQIGTTYSLQRLDSTLQERYGIDASFDDVHDDLYHKPWPDMDPSDILTLSNTAKEIAQDYSETSDDGPIDLLKMAAEKYRIYHDVAVSPSSTAVHRSMLAVHDLRQDGIETTVRGCDIDKQAHIEDLDKDKIEDAFMDEELIEAREDTMADRIMEAADESKTVIGVIGRYHHRGVRERLEAERYDIDGGIMPGTSGQSDAYGESVIAQYET